jgi:hypothetical protein
MLFKYINIHMIMTIIIQKEIILMIKSSTTKYINIYLDIKHYLIDGKNIILN